jgi:glucose/arabinose dehydrogenase
MHVFRRPTISPRQLAIVAVAIATVISLAGCYNMRPSSGGGQTSFGGERRFDAADVAVPAGYKVEIVAKGFTYPTGVAFDQSGTAFVTESGYSYGEDFTTPALVRVDAGGKLTRVASGSRNGPWNGVAYGNGAFYVAEGGETAGGRILRITPTGETRVVVAGLPSLGDHHTDGPVVGPDGWIYFGQGTATNSGVVGEDNLEFGWLKRHPEFHDIPGEDIMLSGENFVAKKVVTGQGDATTGAFSPFGTPTTAGQVIKGRVPCTGGIMKVPADGGAAQLVAWGFRNPFGLAFAPNGRLYVTENGFDDRGSRPVWGTGDPLWEVRSGTWYGWPDFSAGEPLTKPDFKPPGKSQPQFLLARHPNIPPKPAANLGVHSSANGFDFSRSADFGHAGEAFVAMFGDQAPKTGKVENPVGFKVVRVNVHTGAVEDFMVNHGHKTGPASLLKNGGIERPIAARFSPDGRSLYVVDFGVMTMSEEGPHPIRGTGALWRIVRE